MFNHTPPNICPRDLPGFCCSDKSGSEGGVFILQGAIMSKWETYDNGNPQPKTEGCYAIYLVPFNTKTLGYRFDKPKLVYIGTAKDLRKRLDNHPVRCRFGRPYHMRTTKIRLICGKDRFDLEKKLIKRLKPILNKAHNG
jgi:hypothetical protein